MMPRRIELSGFLLIVCGSILLYESNALEPRVIEDIKQNQDLNARLKALKVLDSEVTLNFDNDTLVAQIVPLLRPMIELDGDNATMIQVLRIFETIARHQPKVLVEGDGLKKILNCLNAKTNLIRERSLATMRALVIRDTEVRDSLIEQGLMKQIIEIIHQEHSDKAIVREVALLFGRLLCGENPIAPEIERSVISELEYLIEHQNLDSIYSGLRGLRIVLAQAKRPDLITEKLVIKLVSLINHENHLVGDGSIDTIYKFLEVAPSRKKEIPLTEEFLTDIYSVMRRNGDGLEPALKVLSILIEGSWKKAARLLFMGFKVKLKGIVKGRSCGS